MVNKLLVAAATALALLAGPAATSVATEVGTVATTVTATATKVAYGTAASVRVAVSAADGTVVDGTVAVKVRRTTYTATLENGAATVLLPATLKRGVYAVRVSYLGTATYAADSGRTRVRVTKAATEVAISSVVLVVGKAPVVTVAASQSGRVKVTVRGERYVSSKVVKITKDAAVAVSLRKMVRSGGGTYSVKVVLMPKKASQFTRSSAKLTGLLAAPSL